MTLVHVPTGNVKSTTTNADGEYAFTNLRVGGPYTIKAEDGRLQAGPRKTTRSSLSASAARADTTLELHVNSEVIEAIAGTRVQPNTSSKTVLTAQDIESLPSISR